MRRKPELRLSRRGLLAGAAGAILAASAPPNEETLPMASAAPETDKLKTPLWVADFETGDLSQWRQTRRDYVPGGVTPVSSVPGSDYGVRQGRWAAKFLVRRGDDPYRREDQNPGNPRAELVAPEQHFETEGQEFFYAWSTLFPEGFPTPPKSAGKWQLFTQWHHDDNNSSPPIEFIVEDGALVLGVNARDPAGQVRAGKRFAISALSPSRWHDFVFHVRWSSTDGFVELWHRLGGAATWERPVSRTVIPTMYKQINDDGSPNPNTLRNYLKHGYYRSAKIEEPAVLYHDGMRKGLTRESVAY